jgi:ectoine hydroxylase-related dioxygenase (phytanoyl-CoA dioxygenase family)
VLNSINVNTNSSISTKTNSYQISENQIKNFYEVGFFVIPQLFKKSEIQEISESFNRLQKIAEQLKTTQIINGTQYVVEGSRIDRIVWMGGAEPSLLKYGEDPRLLIPISQILNVSEVNQLICQGHYKLPGDNVSFDWHQDTQHRGYGSIDWVDVDQKGSYVQTLMAIDESTHENGPVKFIPYSSKRGYLGLDQHPNPKELFDINEAVPLILQPGDVAFFSPYAIHGSEANLSQKPRRVFINGFAYPGANKKTYPGKDAGRLLKINFL